MSYDFSHKFTIRNKTSEQKGREEKIKQDENREGCTSYERDSTIGNKLRVAKGRWLRHGVTG